MEDFDEPHDFLRLLSPSSPPPVTLPSGHSPQSTSSSSLSFNPQSLTNEQTTEIKQSEEDYSESTHKRKGRFAACYHCRLAKKKCGEKRPCARCLKLGKECLSFDPNKRMNSNYSQDENALFSFAQTSFENSHLKLLLETIKCVSLEFAKEEQKTTLIDRIGSTMLGLLASTQNEASLIQTIEQIVGHSINFMPIQKFELKSFHSIPYNMSMMDVLPFPVILVYVTTQATEASFLCDSEEQKSNLNKLQSKNVIQFFYRLNAMATSTFGFSTAEFVEYCESSKVTMPIICADDIDKMCFNPFIRKEQGLCHDSSMRFIKKDGTTFSAKATWGTVLNERFDEIQTLSIMPNL